MRVSSSHSRFLKLPTAYCLLPTAYCLLPTAYCLLPTLVAARYPSRFNNSRTRLARWRRASSSGSQAAWSDSSASRSRRRAIAARPSDRSCISREITSSCRAISSPSTRLGKAESGWASGSPACGSDHPGHANAEQGRDLLLTVPHVTEDPEVRDLGRHSAAKHRRCRHELQDLDSPAVLTEGDFPKVPAPSRQRRHIDRRSRAGRHCKPAARAARRSAAETVDSSGPVRSSSQPAVSSRGRSSLLRFST